MSQTVIKCWRTLCSALWISLIAISGCSASALPKAPTDQLIEGPFTLTTEWQTIPLNKPLKTLPNLQALYLFLNDDDHEVVPPVFGKGIVLEKSY